jgi:hypothetical protein
VVLEEAAGSLINRNLKGEKEGSERIVKWIA